MLEGYYLLGIPIDLRSKDLGVIHQITYREFIENNLTLDELLKPFLMKKEMLKGENDEFNSFLDTVGNLGVIHIVNENSPQENIINNLIKTLKLLYKTEDVCVNPNTKYIEINEDIIIDIEKFEIISTVILEMFKIEKAEIEDKSKMDEFDLAFEKKRREYQKKVNKKKKKLNLHDIVNFIIHTNEFGVDYKKIMDMTIYQIKNTYETLMAKQNFETVNELKLHQFDTSKMRVSDWRNKKIVISSEIDL